MEKTVLITGASRGIGAGCALLFAKHGYNVAVHYNKSEKQALEIKAQAESSGVLAAAFQADVSDSAQVNRMTASVLNTFGRIDILVNNAGIAQQKLLPDITDKDWQAMLGTNLSGMFYCCRAVLPHMLREHRGAIVNIASMWGITGASCEVHYSAAKGGAVTLTKALAKEVAPSGIRVNCVCPGVIQTEMNAQLSGEALEELKAETPLGRLGTPLDVAKAVCFLAEEEHSPFITGQVLGVDGGFNV